MDNLDELKGLDEVFESREVLQDKGKFAINALQYLISKERLSGEFYPALNAFMVEFIERFELVEKLSDVEYCDVISFMTAVDNDEDKRVIQRSVLNIKDVIFKHIDIVKQFQNNIGELNKMFKLNTYCVAESPIPDEDIKIIEKSRNNIRFLADREHFIRSGSYFYKNDGFLGFAVAPLYPIGHAYIKGMNLKDIMSMSGINTVAIPLFKLDDQN
jgi:hypothetical protein